VTEPTKTPAGSMLLARKVNESLLQWAKSSAKLVVAVDGYTGIGKTTLLRNLAALNPDVLPVNRDDFLFSSAATQAKLAKATDRVAVFEREICDHQKLAAFITTYRQSNEPYHIDTYNEDTGEINVTKTFDFSKKIMVVEGIFMFHPELPLNKLWDKRIYLQGDIADIDKRRVEREKAKWGDDYFPETHPDSYFRAITVGLKNYIKQYKPEEIADVVFRV